MLTTTHDFNKILRDNLHALCNFVPFISSPQTTSIDAGSSDLDSSLEPLLVNTPSSVAIGWVLRAMKGIIIKGTYLQLMRGRPARWRYEHCECFFPALPCPALLVQTCAIIKRFDQGHFILGHGTQSESKKMGDCSHLRGRGKTAP